MPLVRLLLPFILVALLLAACNRQGNGTVQRISPGTWVVEGAYPNGGNFKSTLVVAPDGDYRCQIIARGSSNEVRTFELEGTFRIQDGVLLDTTTKNSSTNAQVPNTSRARILRMDDREIVVRYEHVAGVEYPTNETVLRRVK